jgi:endonuclease YncB( thermonuclease family)
MTTEYLNSITYKDTIPYIPNITYGKVIKVYDGDTITIACKLPHENSPIYRFSVRINGIDCPEIKTSNKTEKECAVIAKTTISHLVLHKIVHLQNVKLEKYGRILADVTIDNISLGDMLCECHLAVKYDGGTKISPNDWIEYYNSSTIRPDKYLHEYTKLNVNKQEKRNEKSSIRKITSYMRNTLSNCLFRKEADSSSV